MTTIAAFEQDNDHNRNNATKNACGAIKACAAVAQLNRAYLHAVIQAYEDHDLALINALGLPLELAHRLTSAPVAVIESLGRFRAPVANFIGDAVVIDRLLNHNLNRTERLKQVDELLQLGGNFEFIARLTGLVYNDVAIRAHAMGLSQPGRRPRMLSDEEWNLAEAAWNATAHMPVLERWIQVAKDTGISIRRLQAAYRKYDYLPDQLDA